MDIREIIKEMNEDNTPINKEFNSKKFKKAISDFMENNFKSTGRERDMWIYGTEEEIEELKKKLNNG